MPERIPPYATEELGYFYDSIHGRVALEELPTAFHSALKAAFSSKALLRLRRIGQLGHTSVSFFSATHTRFSHAVGSMLVMNKLFRHVVGTGLSSAVFGEVQEHYPDAVKALGGAHTMVHCHLLLAALYQDVGELPFQKVAGRHFRPVENDIASLVADLPRTSPSRWNAKTVYTMLCLRSDLGDPTLKKGFAGFDFEFLSFLLTGDGIPEGATELRALLGMVDGIIDADRLDYVYRDASVTIGSLSRPSTVLESIVGYRPGRVVVNDPRPVTDFLSTRMRLWTFVYNAADVRFRHVLLKTVLDGRWDRAAAEEDFKVAGLDPDLTFDRFMKLDDASLMDRVEQLNTANLEHYRQKASKLIQRGTFEYECRVLERPSDVDDTSRANSLPTDLFFDLMADEGHHQLYQPSTVYVRQGLTSRIAEEVPLEQSAGAFSPLFDSGNSAMLVRRGYFLFLPRQRTGANWSKMEKGIASEALYPQVVWEDARRGLACPPDVRAEPGFRGKRLSISYCSKDWPTVVRIVRELYRLRRRYWLLVRPLDGLGSTAASNSTQLIEHAEAVLCIVSKQYLQRALDGNTYIATEVRRIHDRSTRIPVATLCVDTRAALSSVAEWNWGQLVESWRDEEAVAPDHPLVSASDEMIRTALMEALKAIDSWRVKK